ncbi:cation diffusion facilitator family transporter [Halomonas sp. McH1-25]|uniref:cation diffusion facilitator family transporter n=1 Tax=unclassified Halomonas TaxID=2609666 RepID=UPI001EF4EFA1|nr:MULTISPECIES: cation diffusion facilitator family transporter [unclassified Halomonas]MCG7598930.1 cation diffusion facilitator family transporter [Halomonas sp. McH1-25]MCP1344180.1 cation diffusion facilitator family transporter [Halomonas sp. FL8]MCP1363027.1 cation diffusion facilitator family transporter [Halomonas sp. BBD45]MCP1363825.1 cation diffusion facilitator family transporter [Halomonas sp. BBD48]
MDEPCRHQAETREAHKVTLIGAAIDTLLGVAKVIVGYLVGSAALIADGVHSFSDLATDALVLMATHYGRQAPDRNHPYGHGRIETLATLLLGSVMIFVAGGIAWASLMRLVAGAITMPPGVWAIALAGIGIIGKEWIFRYTLRVAKRLDSRLLAANAWHSRSDALSTVVVLIGLVGAQFGAGWLDALAAVAVGLLIGKIGGTLIWEAIRELVDTALPEDEQVQMRALAKQVHGVRDVHQLRTRTIGGQVLLDLHIVVAPRVTVSEAHEIGNQVCRELNQAFPSLSDVTFHIDPQDDSDLDDPTQLPEQPLRSDVESALNEAWHGIEAWQRRVALDLHYLDNRIDVSLYTSAPDSDPDLDEQARQLREAGTSLPWLGRLRVWHGPGKA